MNLNYIRFKKILDDMLTKTLHGGPYIITDFGNLQPQSYCTKLREAYKYLKEMSPFEEDHVFSWSTTKVIVRPRGTKLGRVAQFEPQRQTIKVNTTDVKHIDILCTFAHLEYFELPLELPGVIPPNMPPFVETTQLERSYLIH